MFYHDFCLCRELFERLLSNIYSLLLSARPQRQTNVKPWPNGVASRRKLKTWVYLRLRLARPWVRLCWLAMTCAHFGRDQICTQVKASFSPFGLLSQVNASWVTSISLSLTDEVRKCLPWNGFICDLRELVRKLACPFGHPTQVSTQVQPAATCEYLRVRLVKA